MRAYGYARAMNVFTCSSLAGSVSDTGDIYVPAKPEIPLRKHVSGVLIQPTITVPA
jgi:hypothetical protein